MCWGLNAALSVSKIKRCSCVGAMAADLLSKGELSEALQYMEYYEDKPGYVPRTLIRWLESPRPTRVLGHAILLELRSRDYEVMIDFVIESDMLDLAWTC